MVKWDSLKKKVRRVQNEQKMVRQGLEPRTALYGCLYGRTGNREENEEMLIYGGKEGIYSYCMTLFINLKMHFLTDFVCDVA